MLLIKAGADLNITNNQKNTPLIYATKHVIDKLGIIQMISNTINNKDNHNKLQSS